jgi:membrane-associated protein
VVTSLLERLEDLDVAVLLAAMLFLAAAEAAIVLDLLVPGEVAMVLGGAVLAEQDGPVVLGMLAAALGAAIGDSLSFLFGATVGVRAVERWSWLRRHFGQSIERARRYFDRRGGLVVFVARFIGALRAVVPFVAASSGMRYRRFLLWDLPAAALWGPLMVGLGAAFGDDLAATIDRFDLWLTLAVIGGLAVWVLVRATRHRRHGSDAQAP